MAPYASRAHPNPLDRTERLAARVLCLPVGAGVQTEDIVAIARLIVFAVEHSRTIRSELTT
jgi:hypothetical protein